MRHLLLAAVVALASCGSSGGWSPKPPSKPEMTTIEPDDPPADMGARDANSSPDLGLVKCGVGPTGLPTCPSTDFYCWPDNLCHPCGFESDYCCIDKKGQNYCQPGNRCSGECPTAYAKSTRCEDEWCGNIGKACRWRWERPGLCGNAQPREICNFGTCVDHRCVMKP